LGQIQGFELGSDSRRGLSLSVAHRTTQTRRAAARVVFLVAPRDETRQPAHPQKKDVVIVARGW